MSLNLQTKQNQTMSQRMIQSVRILQMTSQELDSYINDLALENPVMDVERPADESIDAYSRSYFVREQSSYLTQRQNNDDDFDPKDTWNISMDRGDTLRDYLLSQLDLRSFTRTEVLILYYLLENLDGRGYLTEDTAFVAEQYDTEMEDVEYLIHCLQSLEPTGICARSLGECLRLQLAASDQLDEALDRILDECLELVAKNKYAAISRKLGITAAQAAKYGALIRSLDPKPGSRFYHHDDAQFIIPDTYIFRTGGQFVISLNNTRIPTVCINSYYQNLCHDTEDRQTKDYLEEKIRQTNWLCRCISQRQTTLQRLSEEIFRRQTAFFANGPDYLQAMKMSEVADALEMHESTVSRAIDKKYLQCDHGVFPMHYFFQRKATARSSRSVALSEQNYTNSDIKRMLREIIQTEDPKKPFSDRILGEKLQERGVSISRRTISKYREEAGIPDASGRKNLY